jgi:hypothetical protein
MPNPDAQLRMVEQHILQGEAMLLQQQQILASSAVDGAVRRAAERLLLQLEHVQQLHHEHKARLLAQVGPGFGRTQNPDLRR